MNISKKAATSILKLVVVGFLALGLAGCVTAKPYSFGDEGAWLATLDFVRVGTSTLTLVKVNASTLPEPAKQTFWNPIMVPAGEHLEVELHAVHTPEQSGSFGLLGALVTGAINAGRAVDTVLTISLPPLDAGEQYSVQFIKGIGIPGENKILVRHKKSGTVLLEQIFEYSPE